MNECKKIASLPNDKRYKAYEDLVKNTVKKKDCKAIGEIVDHVLKVEGSDQHGRTYITLEILLLLIKLLSPKYVKNENDLIDIEDLLPLAEKIVPMLREKGDDFPDALMEGIALLASIYQAESEWKKAAFLLSGFRFENFRQCTASASKKVDWYIDATETWLECDETGSASQQIKKAHALMGAVKDNLALVIRFKTSYARVLDAERKFLEASMHYKQLSQIGQSVIGEGDMLKTLERAVTCAILASAGPSRSRVLALLYSDERAQSLHNYGLLEKVFKERIIRDAEVKQFEKSLSPHQNALTSSGMTVLYESITEHNMLATSKLYNNIKFNELAVLLGISAQAAEKLASGMIEQGRLTGVIDQIEGVVEFSHGEGDIGTQATWDFQIKELCVGVNHVLETINSKFPKGYEY